MTCAVIGDSIAVDVGRAMPQCAMNAKIGIGSAAIIGRVVAADLTVISAGSNDPLNPALASNLESMRNRCKGRVIWILPIQPHARNVVGGVAARHGDATVSFAPARDNVHPRVVGQIVTAIGAAR
jgi:hypothetical protein